MIASRRAEALFTPPEPKPVFVTLDAHALSTPTSINRLGESHHAVAVHRRSGAGVKTAALIRVKDLRALDQLIDSLLDLRHDMTHVTERRS